MPAALSASSLLRLIWLASPALPVGGFSYSEGLESAVDAGLATTEAQVGDWLLDQMHLSQARSEWPVLAQAMAAWRAGDTGRAARLNAWVLHTRESSELRLQTEQMGRSLTDWLRHQHGGTPAHGAAIDALAAMRPAYPIALALACVLADAPVREALLACAFGWAENMVQAAVKAVPLGQSAGQRILARLAQEIPAAADGALDRGEGGMQAFTPRLAILSARHEAQYSRLFRS